MPFKIVQVQTVRGKSVLRAVPFNWEKNGTLYWPPVNPDKMRRLEHSVPDETWTELKCEVKKTNIVSFQTAENLLEKMANEPVFVNVNNSNDQATPGKSDVSNAVLSNMATKIDRMMQMLTNFQTKQDKLLHNQRIMLSRLSEISIRLEEYSKQPSWPTIENGTGSNQSISIPGFNIKTIENEEDLKNFESMLENPIIEAELRQKFIVICGVGRGRGPNNAYTLVDVMFSRKFLHDCSWAGGSRTETPKLCFKSFNNTINFFFKLVHESDDSYTMVDCQLFFKRILKNSRKRCDHKGLRMSTGRRKRRLMKIKDHHKISEEEQQMG